MFARLLRFLLSYGTNVFAKHSMFHFLQANEAYSELAIAFKSTYKFSIKMCPLGSSVSSSDCVCVGSVHMSTYLQFYVTMQTRLLCHEELQNTLTYV